MTLRLAVLVSHPIQYFAPWHREIAKLQDVELRVFFFCDWGVKEYADPEFGASLKWDIPLLEGYEYEFLESPRRPDRLSFKEVDNPGVGEALDRFDPHVVQIFGYTYRTNWRVAKWARRRQRPLMIVSDSNDRARRVWWKRAAKYGIVRHFYNHVDGAFFVGTNNRAYHQRYGVPPERLFRGMLPIDRDRLLSSVGHQLTTKRNVRRDFGIPSDAFVVLLCGKYVSRKRPLDLVAAAWGAACKGLPVWSLLVGDGPERAAIEEFCRGAGVTNAVLTGFVNQSNIADFYVASDVNALPSSQEPYGLVAVEGATFGLPIIASDQVGCVGADDMARPGVNALVYPCGDREALQDAIEELYSDKDLYREMSAASQRMSEGLDVTEAAKALATAAYELRKLGPR